MIKRTLISLLTVFLMTFFCATSYGQTMQSHDMTLDNGLKVVVLEDHRAPIVVTQVWYNVGSGDEHKGITGISHMLEHMMFQGTTKYPDGIFSHIVAENGGSDNAFTSDDFTAYYEELDASKLELSIELEADRMVNLVLNEEAFQKEREVVKEERRLRTDDVPTSVTYERFLATAFHTGPYHHPVIGWMHDIAQYSLDDLKAWYNNWYAPNNATLVVVGAVKPEQVFELAKQYFGPIEKQAPTKVKAFDEIPNLGTKRVEVNMKAKLPYLMMGFRVPTTGTVTEENAHDPYALMLMDFALSGGESARLSKSMIRDKEMAVSASSRYLPIKRYDTQFMLSAIPAAGVTTADLEAELLSHVETLKTELITEEELKKLKTQIIADEIFDRDSMSEQAILVGMFESVGLDYKQALSYTDNIKKVTPEQIKEVANRYFDMDNLTVATLIPKTDKEGQTDAE